MAFSWETPTSKETVFRPGRKAPHHRKLNDTSPCCGHHGKQVGEVLPLELAFSWVYLCTGDSCKSCFPSCSSFHRTPFSLSHYFLAIGRAEIYKPSGFIGGSGVGVEAEARDSQMTVWEKLEGVKALGLYRELPPGITVLAGSARCSGCCHPCLLGSSDERRQ